MILLISVDKLEKKQHITFIIFTNIISCSFIKHETFVVTCVLNWILFNVLICVYYSQGYKL